MMTEDNFKKYLSGLGINPNKTFGQNFLINDLVLHDIIDTAKVSSQDTVLEIGAGIGNLTELLANRAGKVVALEKDEQFRGILNRLARRMKNLEIFFGDVLTVNFWPKLPKNYKVVANIPYYITGKILQLFLRADHKPLSITLLTQTEVALNICAKPGKLNLLGLSVQLVGEGKIITNVPSTDFFPAPKVNSSVVHIEIHKKNLLNTDDEKIFFKILHAAFVGKRKQLHNSLTHNLGLNKLTVNELLTRAHVKLDARPQELNLTDWQKILVEYKKVVGTKIL